MAARCAASRRGSLLLPPGTWTWELHAGEAVRSRGVLELSAEQSALLTLDA